MTANRSFPFIVVLIAAVISSTDSAKILGIFPFSAKSHYVMFEPLMLELSRRGHDVTVISAFPQRKPVTNFTDIDGSRYLTKLVGGIDIVEHAKVPNDPFSNAYDLYKSIDNATRIFEIPAVKEILRSKDVTFDLIITELFNTDLTLGFIYRFNTPFIALSSCGLFPWTHSRFGNPDNPSYIPVVYSGLGRRMDFWQRGYNVFASFLGKFAFLAFYNTRSQRLAEKYFGDRLPSLIDIGKNTTLVLVNTHHSLHGARPIVPAVVEVGGMHIKAPVQLPKDLEKFINESKHGVIYFCMGSMLKAATLPDDKREALINVFSKLPQRILWKWENETMVGKPDNVKLVKWMPQRDVLAHPNIRLFISHGGLLGTTEAVHSGVPILGMPFYGDQGVNIAAVVANGAGLRLDFKDLNKETLHDAIKELLGNPKYKENAKDLSERFRDRPQTPLETAVYWTEYVIRHKGAPHLRSAAVDLTWYQYLLLDVIAFIVFVLVAILAVVYYTIKKVYQIIKGAFSKPKSTKTKKRKHQ